MYESTLYNVSVKTWIFAVHFGGGVIGVLAVPLFSKDFGVVYFWDRTAGLVSACITWLFAYSKGGATPRYEY